MPTDPTPDPHESQDPYVETRDGQVYVRGSDVRLERLILMWGRGQVPDALRDQFPSLSLAAIYGAVAYALGHKDELDRLTAEYQRQHPEEAAAGRGMGYLFHRVVAGERPHDEGVPSDRDRFDKFDARARKTFSLAQEEAQRFNHNYIGTEHLLLGTIREGEGIAGRVLESLGVTYERAKTATNEVLREQGGQEE